jgi:WD40 repeat protein
MLILPVLALALLATTPEVVAPTFGNETTLLIDNDAAVIQLCITTDEKFLFAIDRNHRLHLWNLVSGKKTRLGIHGPQWLAITGNGKFIFSGGDGSTPGNIIRDNRGIIGLPESIHAESMGLWATNIHRQGYFPDTVAFPEGHRFPITGAQFSANGSLLVTVSGKAGGSGEVKMWDVPSGKERLPRIAYTASEFFGPSGKDDLLGLAAAFRGTPGVQHMALSSDGATLATTYKSTKGSEIGSGTLKVWDTSHGNRKFNLVVPDQAIHALAFTLDGKTLAVGVGNKVKGEIWLLDETGKLTGVLQAFKNALQSLALAPDGKTLAAGSGDGTVKLWDLTSKKELISRKLANDPEHVLALSFSPNGRKLLVGGGNSKGWIKSWEITPPFAASTK